jgi:two-component system, NarL family, response regulator NreC
MNANAVSILLVDDHAMVREGLRRVLQDQKGMTVVGEASCSQSALEQIRTLAPEVVVMDIHLKGENGIATSRRILDEFPSIKIIVLSADASSALITEALLAGISAYVIKENSSDELIRAVRSVMDHRTYLSPEVASVVVGNYVKSLSNLSITASKPLLTDRERQLLKLVAEGKRNKEIAELLKVRVKSVETYRARLTKKLGCANTSELIRYAIREGITSL